MTARKSRSHSHADLNSLSHAFSDLCRACMSFPTPGDVSWKMRNPHHRDPKAKKKSA